MACEATAGVNVVNMAADCMIFKVFDILFLSFPHNTSEDLKKVFKVLKRGIEDLFYLKNICYLFGTLFAITGLIASRLTLTSLPL